MTSIAHPEIARPPARRSSLRTLLAAWSVPGVLPSWLALIPILALQAGIALTRLRNTVFQDEGLYIYAGRQIFRHWTGGPAPLEQYGFYFSGYPDFYPVIGGVLDKLGGLELARAFSLLCMLGVTALAYNCTRKLFSFPAAIFAAAAYAYLGTVLYVGRLATFDALCLFLIALSTTFALRGGAARYPWLALLVGPLMVVSILAKYAAMLFVPSVLGLVIASSIAFRGWWRMVLRFTIAAISFGLSLDLAYHSVDRVVFHAIAGSTTNRLAIVQKPRLEMLLHVLYMGAPVYAAALIGLVLVLVRCPRLRLTALILFGSAWLAPAYHIYKQEAVSFDKHIAFSLFFAAPLAGYAIAWLAAGMQGAVSAAGQSVRSPARSPGGHYGLAGVAVILIVVTLGMQQSRNIYSGWADTSRLTTVLHTQMRDGGGRYLAEDIEVARYDARDITESWQWNGPYYFYYVTASHQELLGDPAIVQAIKDRYLVLVELSFVHSPGEARFIAEQMAASRNYDLVTRVFFEGNLVGGGPLGNRYGNGYYYLFRLAPAEGQGNFTNISQIGLR